MNQHLKTFVFSFESFESFVVKSLNPLYWSLFQ